MGVRLVMAVSKDNSLNKEQIIFTNDLDPGMADDYFTSDMKVTFDQIIKADLPMEFPMDHVFTKDIL